MSSSEVNIWEKVKVAKGLEVNRVQREINLEKVVPMLPQRRANRIQDFICL